MNRDIELYIDGKLIEWNGNPNIQFTYQTTDYTNPTVVKNNFSKTLKIDGTAENNRIFNEIWHLDRVMDATYSLFNPSQKVPFELYRNDEIVEKGYAKLDSIDREGYKIGYNLTLYGGLGSFFYALDYDINSDKQKSLADLDFMGTNTPDDEFTFEINKNRVYDAWSRLGHTGNTGSWAKWNYINFAPCYNGYPENFDTSKVIMNTHGLGGMAVRWTNDSGVQYSTFPHSISNNGTAFTPYNGYIYGDLNKDLTEWETRDLRSYLQRPVMSIKGLFDAIKRPQNNGGYTVNLDPDFFSDDNPYYSKAWVTLPLLDSAIETEGETEEFLWSGDTANKVTFPRGREQSYRIVPISNVSLVPNKLEFNVEVHTTFSAATADKLYTSIRYGNQGLYGGLLLQLYINKDLNLHLHPEATGGNPNPVCGSNRLILTSKDANGYYWSGMQNYTSPPYKDVATEWRFGYWQKVSGHDYVWTLEDGSTTINFTIDTDNINLIPMICYWSKNVCNYSNMNDIYQYTGMAYSSQTASSQSDALSKGYAGLFADYLVDQGSFKITRGGDVTRSYTTITKKTLFSGLDVTPCDWLLGYCKLFGLYIFKDKNYDIIYIRMRNNFYNNEIVDIEDTIDIGKEMKITPLTFDSKWYTLNYTESSGKFLDAYKKNYNQDFGKQLIDTKYNFDSEDVDLLEGIVYRNGLTALEKSNYFNNKYDIKQFQIPTVLYDWVKFKYYALEETYETNMALPQGCAIEYINPFMDEEYYDVIPKLQFHDVDNKGTDGEGVLVFFNGAKNMGKVKYWITDDLDEMFRESDNPCWIATMDEWNHDWTERIAIGVQTLPEFNRYVVHDSNIPVDKGGRYKNITAAWDFGRTKELFVPYYRYDVDKTPTIYENFWHRYINDLYSVDTRKVDAYVNLNTNSVYDALKRFYWFNNCLWVMTKVENYDICLERATKCSFTKVNDLNSYLHDVTFDDFYFRFYRIGAGNIPYTGTTAELTANFMLDSSSDWYVMTGDYTIASMVDGYSANAVSGTAGDAISVQAIFTPNLGSSPRSVTFYGVNIETNMMIPITITQDCWQNSSHLFLSTVEYPIPMTTTNMTFMVLVYSSDPWMADCSESWVHIQTPTGNTGDGVQFFFTCDSNTNGEERYATVKFSNGIDLAEFKIIQKGKAKGSIEQVGNTAIVDSTGQTLDYQIICDTDWQLVSLGSSSAYTSCLDYGVSHSATTGYTTQIVVAQNNSTVSRNIMFQLEFANMTQKPTQIPLPLIQESSGNTVIDLKYDATGGTIDLNASLPWKASTYNTWISLGSDSGTSADTNFEFTVTQNDGSYRVGYITIEYTDEYGYPCSEVFEIKQEGNIGHLTVSPTAITASYSGGTYLVTVSAPTTYTATTNNDWIILDMDNRGIGITTFSLTENEAKVGRIGKITFTDGVDTVEVEIQQQSSISNYFIIMQPSAASYTKTGGSGTVTIYCEGDWVLGTNDAWITLNANSGNGNTIVPYTVSANSSTERDGIISGYVVNYPQYSASTMIRQEANRYLYSDSFVNVPMSGSSAQVTVYSNVDWVAETEDSWIIISPASGSGDGILTITVQSGNTERNGSIILTNEEYGLLFEITVSQEDTNKVWFRHVNSMGTFGFPVTTGWGATFLSEEYESFIIGTVTYYSGTTGYFDCDVTAIPDKGLKLNDGYLAAVKYPSTVTSIGDSAFTAQALTAFTFNNSIESIGVDAFSDCYNCKFTNAFPNSLKTIGNGAFGYCSQLTGVTIPSGVTNIGSNAFALCGGLTYVNIQDLFAWCNISFGNNNANPVLYAHHLYLNNTEIIDLVIPSGITSILDYTFYGASITSVTFTNSVTGIGASSFSRCKSLKNLTIPSYVNSIGKQAFSYCTSLEYIEIPSTVTTLGTSLFERCSGLTGTTIKTTSTPFGGFENCVSLSSVELTDNVTTIDVRSFSGCTGLREIVLPSSITSIGSYAFDKCSNLTSIYSYATNCPSLSTYNPFDENISPTGTLHYPSGSDYSRFINKLPSGWTAIADL